MTPPKPAITLTRSEPGANLAPDMKKILVLTSLLLFAASVAIGAEEVPGIPGLNRYTLSNGLEVYAYRDASVPLARVQIAFKAGAVSQGPESAGLFRLYERALFGGPPAQPGSASVKGALASLGVAGLEGGTETERISYWITLPSSEVASALAFWAGVFVSPTIDPDAFEAQKEAVLQDIESRSSDPESIYEAALDERLFPKYPWTRDPIGSEKAVRAATVASLKALAAKWFVPNNAAIFIGGDIDPEDALAAARSAFEAWAAGPDPWARDLPKNPRPGVVRPTWVVYPDPSMPEGTGTIEARYRGPDLAFDLKSSYAADLWSSLVSPPDGRFKTAIAANVPGLGDKEGIVAEYVSRRDGGWISISSPFTVDPTSPASDRAHAFKEREGLRDHLDEDRSFLLFDRGLRRRPKAHPRRTRDGHRRRRGHGQNPGVLVVHGFGRLFRGLSGRPRRDGPEGSLGLPRYLRHAKPRGRRDQDEPGRLREGESLLRRLGIRNDQAH